MNHFILGLSIGAAFGFAFGVLVICICQMGADRSDDEARA
jgi:hypothetical protein